MENAPSREPRKAALIFVFVTVALDVVALGVIAPVFVPLVEGFMHENIVAAAGVVGVFGTVFALMQFVWAPVLGVLSESYLHPITILSPTASDAGRSSSSRILAWASTTPSWHWRRT